MADAGHEGQAIDQLARSGEGVPGAQAVDDGLRAQLFVMVMIVLVAADHDVGALVLAGEEVLARAAVVGAEGAAVVPVGAGEEPEVTPLAEQRVPHAADLRAIHARAAVGGAAHGVGVDARDVVAVDGVFAARVGRAVARLGLHAEGDVWRGVVEVAQVLDVVAVVAVGVERAGALEVCRNVVAAVRMVLDHPLHGLDSLRVALRAGARAAGLDELLGEVGPAEGRIGRAAARGIGAVPVVADAAARTFAAGSAHVGDVAPARVRDPGVEAVGPLRQPAGVADRRVARGDRSRSVRQRGRVEPLGDLPGDDRHRRVLVTRNDRLQTDEQRSIQERVEVFDQGILVLLDRLPAPHGRGAAGPVAVALDIGRFDTVGPCRPRPDTRAAHAAVIRRNNRTRADDRSVGQGDRLKARVGRGAQGVVFHQGAVARGAAVAVAGLHEPVQSPGRLDGVGGLLHQLLHRDRAVGAGGVVVEIARDVGSVALSVVSVAVLVGVGGAGRRAQGHGAERRGDCECDLASAETNVHRKNSLCG